MAKKTDLSTSSRPQYTRAYTEVRGVDLSSDPARVAINRAANMVNMYRDYASEHGAAIESIPGYRRLYDFGGAVHGIWGYASSQDLKREDVIIVHAGTRLLCFGFDDRDSGRYDVCYEGLADAPSSAVLQNNKFYIADGTGIYVLSPHEPEAGEVAPPKYDVITLQEAAYVPITYISGQTYEQRNMLTNRFVNRDTLGTDGLFKDQVDRVMYYDPQDASVWKSLISDYQYTITTIGNETTYTITDIIGEARVLDELDARQLLKTSFAYNQNDMGYNSFIRFAISPELIEKRQIRRIIGDVPTDISSLVEEHFSGESDSPMYDMYVSDVTIYDRCTELIKVSVNGKIIPPFEAGVEADMFYLPVRERLTIDGKDIWYISFLHIYAKSRSDIEASEVDIYGLADEVKIQTSGLAAKHTDYLNSNKEYSGTSIDAILGCKLCATFDGRVFLTGNKLLPNTVFYSCRDLTGYNNPAYYGVYNYFNDGIDNTPNTALLATSSVLMVLKENTISGSSIYYHVGEDGFDDVIPRIYPATPGVAGIGCKGAALNFLDDAIFASDRGIDGISKQALNLERTIGHRSSTIDRALKGQGDVMSGVSLCRWGGYLCVFDGMGRVFLGDSRQQFAGVDGSAEYEWFMLDGIGCYKGDHERYRTITTLPESLIGGAIGGIPLIAVTETQYVDYNLVKVGYTDESSARVYYIESEDGFIVVDTDGELEGGEFYNATIGYSLEDVLFFGTDGGQVCAFNTDKRGLSVGEDIVDVDRIHRSFYNFAGHRYSSYVALKSDDCGVPHLTKRTTRKTCVLKLKSMAGSRVTVKVKTDRETWEELDTSQSNNIFSFDDVDFDNFTFSSDDETIVCIKDKKKKWVEKQYLLRSDGYQSPFGFYNLVYNYEIQGRVKR